MTVQSSGCGDECAQGYVDVASAQINRRSENRAWCRQGGTPREIRGARCRAAKVCASDRGGRGMTGWTGVVEGAPSSRAVRTSAGPC